MLLGFDLEALNSGNIDSTPIQGRKTVSLDIVFNGAIGYFFTRLGVDNMHRYHRRRRVDILIYNDPGRYYHDSHKPQRDLQHAFFPFYQGRVDDFPEPRFVAAFCRVIPGAQGDDSQSK